MCIGEWRVEMMWNEGYEKSVAGAHDPKCSEVAGKSLGLDANIGTVSTYHEGAVGPFCLISYLHIKLRHIAQFPRVSQLCPKAILEWHLAGSTPLTCTVLPGEGCCSNNHSSLCSPACFLLHFAGEITFCITFFHVNILHFRNVK